jgi:hypothetical protein
MKKSLFKIAGILILFVCPLALFSQTNFLPGFVITHEADTIKGLIDYRNWAVNPSRIDFRKTSDAPLIRFTPLEIIEFGVAGEVYAGAIVEAEISPVNPNRITDDPSFQFITDTVFLQNVVRGEKSLYHRRNNNGIENFYIKEDGEFTLLRYKKYFIFSPDYADRKIRRLMAENKPFIGQLTLYLANCPTIQPQIERTTYEKKSLERLVRRYYACVDKEMEYFGTEEESALSFGVYIGPTSTSINFEGDKFFNYVIQPSFSNSVNFAAGLSLNISLPRNFGNFSIQNELQYSRFGFEAQYREDRIPNVIFNVHSMELVFSSIKLNNLIRYRLLRQPVELYLNAGISNGFYIEETNYRRIDQYVDGLESFSERKVLDDPKRHELGILGGLGIAKNNFSFEGRYENSSGIADMPFLSSRTQRIFFFLGYHF